MKSKKFKPYVRRANGKEMSSSWVIAYRLAFYRMLKKPFYVMVQHGFPNLAMAVGKTKRDVQRSPLPVAVKRKSFRRWANAVQRRAMGKGGK